MRLLLIVSVFLIACRTHTIPIGSMPAYAANQPVVTREGMALTVEDGGAAILVPHEGHCLSRLPSPEKSDGTIIAGEDPRLPCRKISVQRVQAVDAGEVLRIEGKQSAVEVDPLLVESVIIKGANVGVTDYAPKSEPRSPAMIISGSLLIAAGIAGGTALFTALANVEDGFLADLPRFFYGFLGAASLAGGVAGGTTLVVFGAKPMRAPYAEQPPLPAIQVSGLGLRWALE